MEPKLRDGNFAVFRRSSRVRRGDIVLAKHPEFGWIVKEVGAIAKNGRVALNGMSRLSTNGSRLGSVSRDEVFGKILARVPLLRWR